MEHEFKNVAVLVSIEQVFKSSNLNDKLELIFKCLPSRKPRF